MLLKNTLPDNVRKKIAYEQPGLERLGMKINAVNGVWTYRISATSTCVTHVLQYTDVIDMYINLSG